MLLKSRPTVKTKTMPAPVGGLNDRDSLAEMPSKDAVLLNNWWVRPSKVEVRKGSISWVTGFVSAVETLAEYLPPSGSIKLFAGSNGAIYDVTNSGTLPAASVSGLANNRWQPASMTTPAGNFLYLFNGVDSPQLYDGATWKSITAVSAPAITGVTPTLLVQACVFKSRLWMVEVNSTRAWYLPASSIGGAATSFDIGSIFRQGGYLVGMFSWTLDAGSGVDDLAVFISSNGECAVYRGTDPSSAATFALIGVYSLGRPIGRRCCIKLGGDLLIVCEEGVYPLGKALLSASIDHQSAVTDKIQNSISQAVVAYRLNFGWELILYPEQAMMLLNIPAGNGANYQYTWNTITEAWTKFTGWDARTFISSSAGLFFGDSNSVKKAWTGNLDGTASIQFDALTSFQFFGAETQNKYFTMLRPYLLTGGTPSILYGINGNFQQVDPTGVLSYTPPSNGMVWGAMTWGSMVWGGSLTSATNWNTVGGVYNAAAVRLKGQNNGASLEWSATDFAYQMGGIL